MHILNNKDEINIEIKKMWNRGGTNKSGHGQWLNWQSVLAKDDFKEEVKMFDLD